MPEVLDKQAPSARVPTVTCSDTVHSVKQPWPNKLLSCTLVPKGSADTEDDPAL